MMLNSMLAKIALPVFALVSSVAAVTRPPEPPCVVAEKRVEAHRNSLPTTLSEISKFDLAHRKAIFVALPQAVKLRMWHEQMLYYELAPKLTEQQHAMIREIDKLVDQYADTAHVREFDRLYTPRIKQVLGADLAAQVIANIGVNTPEQRAAAKGDRTLPTVCSCSNSSNWCGGITGPDVACPKGGCTVVNGCGTFFCYDCDGICQENQT